MIYVEKIQILLKSDKRIGTVREDLSTFLDAGDINAAQHIGVKHSTFLYC